MCIILYMSSYYIKKFVNLDPLKPKIMKLTYIGKQHSTLTGQQYILHSQSH
jgi:hypothetical protein